MDKDVKISLKELLCDKLTFDNLRSQIDKGEVSDFQLSVVIHRVRKEAWSYWDEENMPDWSCHNGKKII